MLEGSALEKRFEKVASETSHTALWNAMVPDLIQMCSRDFVKMKSKICLELVKAIPWPINSTILGNNQYICVKVTNPVGLTALGGFSMCIFQLRYRRHLLFCQ